MVNSDIREQLRPFFEPKAVAIIGATNKKGKLEMSSLRTLRRTRRKAYLRVTYTRLIQN